mgnify:CR=1 FL=1
MPKWKKMTVGDLCDTISDTYRGDDKDVVLINTSDVLEGKVLNHQVVENKNLKGQFKKTFKKNDILYSEIRPANKRYAFVDFGDTDNYIASTKLMVLRPRKDVVRPRFLFSFLASKSVLEELQQLAETRSGTFPQITFSSELAPTPINVPDLETQDRIVGILDVIEGKISTNAEINKNLLQQAIALYEHLLQEAEWSTVTILDVAKKVAMGPFGSNIKISTFVPEGVPIISGNHLRGYFLEEPEFNYITEEHAERLKNSIVFPHDIIFTHAGNIGQVAMIPDGCKYDRYVLSQRQFYLRCDEAKVVPEFLLLFFHSASGQHELLSYANQTGVPSIAQPASNLKKIPFKCPPMQEQLMWQEQVHPLLSHYLNNRLENERLSSLRDTLLPKLMSGELDVSGIDL